MEILKVLELGEMTSYMESKSTSDVVQVALSLPSYYSQGWTRFISDCKTNHYRNYLPVWIGKNPDKSVGSTVKGIYYASADGTYAARLIYNGSTKLGSVDQTTGFHIEKI